MTQLNKALGRRRDLPQIEASAYAALAAGSAADPAQDTVIVAVPQLIHAFLPGSLGEGFAGSLPINRMAPRVVSFISQGSANTVGNATNNFELRMNVWRAGVLQGHIAYYSLAVNTTITPAITATGVQAVAVVSAANIVAGSALLVDAGASAELVYVQSISGSNITANFTKTHSAGAAATSALVPFRPVDFIIVGGVNTTSSTAVGAAGSATITPASMHGILVGESLSISGGVGTAETVIVTAVTNTTFTAVFANTHSGTYNIQSASYSGPFELQEGDTLSFQRLSNNATGLASPAGLIQIEWVPSKLLG